MTQKTDITFESLFLHDTQMALLAGIQRTLRGICGSLAGKGQLPFSFMIPFCPVARAEDSGRASSASAESRLEICSPRAADGWIVMPVSGERCPDLPEGLPSFPGYPPLPRVAGFILGYSGETAVRAVEAVLGDQSLATGFSVAARYRATVTASVDESDGGYSVSWTIGPALWEK